MTATLPIITFLLSLGFLFFLPGFLFTRFFLWTLGLDSFETLLLSFGLSLGIVDFLMILIGKLGIPLTSISIGSGLIILGGVGFAISAIRKKHTKASGPTTTLTLSTKGSALFVVILALTILIKVIYLSHSVVPTSTDLGHHMYWAQTIATTGSLPHYEKSDIETLPDGTSTISEPTPIADFIIGEHLPFAALILFSHNSFLSAFPIVFLLLINLLSLLAFFVLAYRLAASIDSPFFKPELVALSLLFLLGPLYTLASPQAKYVSGGVVGNMFGNFFIPLIALLLVRAFVEQRAAFLALTIFVAFTLAYTHHLSTFVFLFAAVGGFGAFIILNINGAKEIWNEWKKLLLSPLTLSVLGSAILFFFLVAMPTYIETNAIGTAVGTPTKTTRAGLSLQDVTSANGARAALGFVGIILFLTLRKTRSTFAGSFILGWTTMLLIMTVLPRILLINIPSDRIGTYLSFPLAIIAAFTLASFFVSHKTSMTETRIAPSLLVITFLTTFIFVASTGTKDNATTLTPKSKSESALETFTASRYLAAHIAPNDIILKDHNYLVSDSWIKTFFLRGYDFPLSRGYFKRYEDPTKPREQCTLKMISSPNTPEGIRCFEGTGTNIVMINPAFDATQFDKSKSFDKIYASDGIGIYKRHQ